MSDPDDHPDAPLPAAPAPAPASSKRGWLERVREFDPALTPVPRPQPPSRRFTWGWRTGLVVVVLFYGALDVLSFDLARLGSPLLVGFAVVVLLVAVVAAVEFWCWAGRPRYTAAQQGAITSDLSAEDKKTVRRMALGRGPQVTELRAHAAATAWSDQQSASAGPVFLTIQNTATLFLASGLGPVVRVVIPGLVFLISLGLLSWTLWSGHRARVLAPALAPALPPEQDPPARRSR